MTKRNKRNRDNKVVSLEVVRDIVPTESFWQEGKNAFPSEISGLDLGIDLNQNKEISATSFSLVERPARSSEEGKVLWERKIVKDKQNGIEVRESWDSEVLNEREDSAIVPTVKESYEGSVEEVSENLTNQEEVVIRSRKWQTEKNEFEEKVTIKFDKNISSRRLIDGGQVNFVEYNTTPMDIDQTETQFNTSEESPTETDFKPLLSDDEIEKADKAQLVDLKNRVEAELEIRKQVETDSSSSFQTCGIEVKPKSQ